MRWATSPTCRCVTDGLGESWEIMATSYKPYPCGFVIHPVLDCVLDWRRDHPQAEVTRVVVRGNPLLAHRTDRPEISTGRESQVSVQHAVAAALVHRQGRHRSVHRRLRATIRACYAAAAQGRGGARRERFPPSPPRSRSRPPTARSIASSQIAARGSDVNPMSDADLEQKLRTVASSWNPGPMSAPDRRGLVARQERRRLGLASLAMPA